VVRGFKSHPLRTVNGPVAKAAGPSSFPGLRHYVAFV